MQKLFPTNISDLDTEQKSTPPNRPRFGGGTRPNCSLKGICRKTICAPLPHIKNSQNMHDKGVKLRTFFQASNRIQLRAFLDIEICLPGHMFKNPRTWNNPFSGLRSIFIGFFRKPSDPSKLSTVAHSSFERFTVVDVF